MNFETEPAAVEMPLRILTLPSGAVSSSWMSKRLMSVFIVMGGAFTLPLAGYLRGVSKGIAGTDRSQAARGGEHAADMVPASRVPDRDGGPMADKRPETADDVIKLVQDRDVRFIRLWFTDVLGQLKSFSINASELEDAFEGGMGFDGSSITGFNPIEESDMIAMPDPSTFAILPWRPEERGVGRMFADIQVPGGEPYEGDPRWIMRRAIQRANEMGFDAYNIGPELEYFYFRSEKPENGTPEVLDEGGYFDLTTLDAGSDVRRETILALEQLGIHVEYAHHEVGPSQHEVDMRYKSALEMSDDCMTYRIVVKEIAMKYGVYATFMPKPLFGENGSGMHVHQSLFSGDSNAFFDADDEYHLSPVAKSFIAGQLKHAREISALFAQWVNSYKRLVPGYEAPVYIAWSRRNRSALIRVPVYHPGKEQATRA